MNWTTRIALGWISLLLPMAASAAAPGNVTGIRAAVQDGGVSVSWQVPQGTVTGYRVFYSHASILGNDGLYDDFETVQGTQTQHLLQNIPPIPELFVSVLAMNGDEESALFAEEARVTLQQAPTPEEQMPSTTVAAAPVLRLLRAVPVSSTGILLTFSHPLHPAVQTPTLFSIATASGVQLPVIRVESTSSGIVLHTAPQTPNEAYRLQAAVSLVGLDEDGTTIPLAADQSPILLSGYDPLAAGSTSSAVQAASSLTTSMPASSVASSSVAPMPLQEVTNLTLRAAPQQNGTYDIDIAWDAARGNIAGYRIAQTTDEGRTYGEERLLGATTNAVRVEGVTAGTFGVRVRVLSSDGRESAGQTRIMELPATSGGTMGTLPGSVTMPPEEDRSTTLPNAGIGLWLLVALAGAGTGYVRTHRLRTKIA